MKVGIITMFYNSCNYGGILQAYALSKVVEKIGLKSEHICYELTSAYPQMRRLKIFIKKIISLIMMLTTKPTIIIKLRRRSRIVRQAAEEMVPHSKRVYKESNIRDCVKDYDAFITGSDQVWSQNWPAFFLNFVPSGYKKIAYAISVGNSDITTNEAEYIKGYTNSFTAILVREEETVEKLRNIIDHSPVMLVLDPTLLLEKNEWEEVASPRIIADNYLFCYFLGPDKRLRDLAVEYAKSNHLKIITIPHMQQRIEKNDLQFGDVQLFYAKPQDFLSCIKYSNAVFTDSFHACVFSEIFEKQYFVFARTEFKKMGNRIRTLTKMFHTESHFINEDSQYNIDYITSIKNIDYIAPSINYDEMKNLSLKFLEINL